MCDSIGLGVCLVIVIGVAATLLILFLNEVSPENQRVKFYKNCKPNHNKKGNRK